MNWSTSCVLPAGWRERAIVVRSAATGGVSGICPDPSDLAVSKLAAWREKDREFVAALLRHRMATAEEIERRLQELEPEIAARIRPRLRSVAR